MSFFTNKLPKPPYFGNRKPPARQHQALPPCQAINEHELDYLTSCLHELYGGDPPSETAFDTALDPSDGVTSVHEDISEPESQPPLAHVIKKKPLQPGNIKQLLSPAANGKPKQSSTEHPQEVIVNGIIYRQVNTISMIYKVSSTQATKSKGALIDSYVN